MPAALPHLRGDPKALEKAGREELVDLYGHYRSMSNEWLRRQILENNRIDILAVGVLGYQLPPFHLRMLQWQFAHPESMQLCFRGAGKSTTCTITKSIWYLLKNPDFRILLASKSLTQAEAFLKEIKGHFENNARLVEVFGEYYDPRKVGKWDNKEIEVLPRTKVQKEASITCVGVDGTVVGRHYDAILCDDLIDEENSRTKNMRDKTRTWFYQTLGPTLEPPDGSIPHRGEQHIQGTRYHFDDLYGWLLANELKDHTQIIPALDKTNRSPWPEKYPPSWFLEKKRKSGTIIFNAQYQCDTEAMKGEIFQYDDCQDIDEKDIPTDLEKFIGIDLAIAEKEKSDMFAVVTIGVDKMQNIYALDYFAGHLRFARQTEKILEIYGKHDPVRACIETNAYQAAQYQTLMDVDSHLRIKPVDQHKDKITRAWKLSSIFEDKKVFFRKGLHILKEHMVLFPNGEKDDLFDAFDLAVRASRMRNRRKRRSEPGLL